MKYSPLVWHITFGVWISDETLLLVLAKLHRRRRILRSVIGGEEATQPTDTLLACNFSQPI